MKAEPFEWQGNGQTSPASTHAVVVAVGGAGDFREVDGDGVDGGGVAADGGEGAATFRISTSWLGVRSGSSIFPISAVV